MTVLDVSNYDYDTFDAACLKAAGVERILVGCQRPALAITMIKAARNAGIEVRDLYSFMYFGLDTTGQTEAAVAVAQALGGIERIWLDCESQLKDQTEAAGQTPAGRASQLSVCVALVQAHGFRAGIYTGGWWWPSQMANTTAFSDLPLWHSAYPDDGHPIRNVNYGGWTSVTIHQYTSGLNLCGRNRDANYVFEENDDMADPRVDAIIAALGGQTEIDKWNANGNSLLLGYAQEQAKLADHLDQHEQTQVVGTKVPPHKHTMGIAVSETGGVASNGG